jgi:hypothetical protein
MGAWNALEQNSLAALTQSRLAGSSEKTASDFATFH